MPLQQYVAQLSRGRVVLWCYLAWYLTTVVLFFDASPAIWLNSVGISVIIGCGLLLSVGQSASSNRWQTARLFMMPFCVSSFSALIKGRDFFLIFPMHAKPLLISVAVCMLCIVFIAAVKRFEAAKC